jgi:hypothetical protein
MHSQNTSDMEVKAVIGVYRNGVVYQLGILVYIRHKCKMFRAARTQAGHPWYKT